MSLRHHTAQRKGLNCDDKIFRRKGRKQQHSIPSVDSPAHRSTILGAHWGHHQRLGVVLRDDDGPSFVPAHLFGSPQWQLCNERWWQGEEHHVVRIGLAGAARRALASHTFKLLDETEQMFKVALDRQERERVVVLCHHGGVLGGMRNLRFQSTAVRGQRGNTDELSNGS